MTTKAKGVTNSDRKNGKAFKNPSSPRGARKNPQTPGDLILLGKGVAQKWANENHNAKRVSKKSKASA